MRRSETESDILKRTFIVFILTVALCISTSTATAAFYREDTVTISLDGWRVLTLWGGRGGILQIDVEVLTEDYRIDVLLMDEYNWNLYNTTNQDKTFSYYPESRLNVNKVSFRFTSPKDGNLNIVLDNSFDPEGGAYVTFPVEVHIIIEDVTHAPSISMIGIALGLGIAFLAVTLKRKFKKE